MFEYNIGSLTDEDIDDKKSEVLEDLKTQIQKEVAPAQEAAKEIDPKEVEAKQIVLGQCALLANLDKCYTFYKEKSHEKQTGGSSVHSPLYYCGRFHNIVSSVPQTTINNVFSKNHSDMEKFVNPGWLSDHDLAE